MDENKQNPAPKQWKEISDDIREDEMLILEVGESLEGSYLGSRTAQANGRSTQIFLFRKDDNTVIGVWDCAQLTRKLARVRKNRPTRLTRLDDIPARTLGYSPEKDFKVEQA